MLKIKAEIKRLRVLLEDVYRTQIELIKHLQDKDALTPEVLVILDKLGGDKK